MGGQAHKQRRARLSTAALKAPFILTVDWLGWLCYFSDKLELAGLLRQFAFFNWNYFKVNIRPIRANI